MIVLSTVIGVTIFQKHGEALKVAGPSGTLLALAIAGVAAISAVEGVSEMIQMFPAPNAAMELVRAFVDPDLAWVDERSMPVKQARPRACAMRVVRILGTIKMPKKKL